MRFKQLLTMKKTCTVILELFESLEEFCLFIGKLHTHPMGLEPTTSPSTLQRAGGAN